MDKYSEIYDDHNKKLLSWLDSCTRGGQISRNTIAVGLVVIDHLRVNDTVTKETAFSQGGELKGARSGLGTILEKYGVPKKYLKEVTTRQGHQDGQRLFESFHWGQELLTISSEEKDDILRDLANNLTNKAHEWLNRRNLILDIDRRNTPTSWIHLIIENSKAHSGGIVEQHLIGAKLETRFKEFDIPNFPAHAADVQTSREGDFIIQNNVFHVTASPSRSVIQKCSHNIHIGKMPILLVPYEKETYAKAIAEDEGIADSLMIISIESFIATNIIELATAENKDNFVILQEMVNSYNKRLKEVETDLSLQIEIK